MDFVEAITIIVTGILTNRVIDGLVEIAPLGQTIVDIVLIGVDQAPSLHGLLN